jgi:hypothetical protein
MPQVDPTNYLMAALSTLTGGLIADIQTLILGLVVCSFILMALDLLKDFVLVPFGEAAVNALTNPVVAYKKASAAYHTARLKFAGPGESVYQAPSGPRRDVEISPLRQYDLDLAYRGADSLPESPVSYYDQKENTWERDGVELSEDQFYELDDALESSRRGRMSDDEVSDMLFHASNDYRRRHHDD